MSSAAKAILGMIVLAVWGPFLLCVWIEPTAVPELFQSPGARRALMLSRDYEPTPFTLVFGIGFTALLPIGVFRLVTGKIA